jgi:hypothetical protein
MLTRRKIMKKPTVKNKTYTEVKLGDFLLEDNRDGWGANLYLVFHEEIEPITISYSGLKDLKDVIEAYLLEKKKDNPHISV